MKILDRLSALFESSQNESKYPQDEFSRTLASWVFPGLREIEGVKDCF